jgi:hypothetical protein
MTLWLLERAQNSLYFTGKYLAIRDKPKPDAVKIFIKLP